MLVVVALLANDDDVAVIDERNQNIRFRRPPNQTNPNTLRFYSYSARD